MGVLCDMTKQSQGWLEADSAAEADYRVIYIIYNSMMLDVDVRCK